MDETEARLATLERILDGFNRHDVDAILACFTDDATFDSPRGPAPFGRRFEGKEAVRAGIAARFAGLPDVHYGEGRHFVAGDRGVSEWLLTGTMPAGERVEARGCDLWEFRGDLVTRKDSYWKLVE